MGSWSEQMVAGIRSRIQAEMDLIGEGLVVSIKENLSTPVVQGAEGEGVLSPKTGWWITERSAPGENPYMETGELRAAERYEIEPPGEIISLDIINDAPHARIVHDGHGPMPLSNGLRADARPFHDLAREEFAPQIGQRILSAITGK